MKKLPTIVRLDEDTGELVAKNGERLLSDDLCSRLDAAVDAGQDSQKLADEFGPWFAACNDWVARRQRSR